MRSIKPKEEIAMKTNKDTKIESNLNDLTLEDSDKFIKLKECELGGVIRDLERAKVAYEKAMRKFVKNYITGKGGFKARFDECYQDTRDSYRYEEATDFVDDILVLETLINEELRWLEEGQFEAEDELLGKV